MANEDLKESTSELKPKDRVFSYSVVFIVVMAVLLFLPRSDESKRIKLPPRYMSDSQSIGAAKNYLAVIYGSERIAKWQAKIALKPFNATQDETENGFAVYPKDQIDYLMQESPSDFPLIDNKYLFTAKRIVRFTESQLANREAIDIYVDSDYRVFGMKYHHAKESLPTIAEKEVLPMTVKALSQIAKLDTTALKLVQMEKRVSNPPPPNGKLAGEALRAWQESQVNKENTGIWHLSFRDEHVKLKSKLHCGYKVSIRGNTVSEIMPYADLDSETIMSLAEQRPIWRRLQQIAYIFVCIFIVNGLIMMFRILKREAVRLVILILMISNLLLTTGNLWSSKTAQIFAGDGFGLFVLETLLMLSILLIGYGFSKPESRPVFPKKFFQLHDLINIILITSLLSHKFMNLRAISLQRYVSPRNLELTNGLMGYIGAIVSMTLILMGLALCYRHLVCTLSKLRWGKFCAIPIALLLSTSIILIINPQVYSLELIIFSIISILSLSVMLYLIQYDWTRTSNFLYSIVFYSLATNNNPFLGSSRRGIWWLYVIDVAVMLIFVWLFPYLLEGKFVPKKDEN